jgi:hypothetical protein
MAAASGLVWPLGEGLNDDALTAMLFVQPDKAAERSSCITADPEYAVIHSDLKRPQLSEALPGDEV